MSATARSLISRKNPPAGSAAKACIWKLRRCGLFIASPRTEKLLPANVAENLSLPRRWKRVPKALSETEIDQLLRPESPETPAGFV